MDNETRAVVIGASVSGLLAAAALSESFDQVVVVERDQLPAGADHRRAVPQSRHLHGLMARGLAAIDGLLPGFENDLAAAGAVRSDLQSDIHWYLDGHLVKPEPSGITGYSMTRRLLEHAIRTRVRALPRVTVTDHCDVLDLIAADGAVTGVRVISRADGAEAIDLTADLVVDAAGRASRTPQWLTSLGYAAPTESTVPVGITYVSREYRRESHHLDGRAGTFTTSFPGSPRGAFLVAVEEDTFLLTTTGVYGEQPPMDDDGLLAFAESLPSDDVATFLEDAVRTSEPARTRFPAGLRRHYESLDAFPSGYLVIGDALCSFNPVYGQGMSVAAAEAELLRDVLRAAPDDLAAEYFRRAARIVDTAWTVAVGRDQQFPEAGITPSQQATEFSAHLRRVYRAAAVDATVGTAFLKVLNLLAGPESLLDPALVERVKTASVAADLATTGGSGNGIGRETDMTITIPSVAAERSEAEALFEFHAAAPPSVQTALGMNRTRLGGGVVTSMAHDVTSYWNKALGFGDTEPVTADLLAEVIAFYRAQKAPVAVIQIAPSQLPPDWPELCAQYGLREGAPWVKLAAPVDEVVARAGAEHSTLLCAPVSPRDAAQWGAVMMRGFGMPEPLYSELAAGTATGHDHWHPYAVWLGSELVGTGTLAVRDGIGHMFGGAVLPHARQRGGQTALIGAGARMAQKLGCTSLVAETGAEGPGEHNSSLHNMLRLGFTVQYERPNWIWTPDPS